MRIAIPTVNGMLSAHFGHCSEFAVIDVDDQNKEITNTESFTPPAHEPGALPKWLSGLYVNLVIAGGMGQRAQMLFNQNNIEVITGAPTETPEEIIRQYLAGTLEYGANICDH